MAAKCEMYGCGQKATTKRQSGKHLVPLCAACAARWDTATRQASGEA